MKKLFKGTIPTIALLLVAVMSLTSLTYAWFTAGDTATVDTVDVDVKAVDGLLVSANGWNGTWGSSLTPILMGQKVDSTTGLVAEDQTGATYRGKLQDVSSAGVLNSGNLVFYNANYDNIFDALTKAEVAENINASADGIANWIQFDMYIKNDNLETSKTVNIDGSTVTGSALSRAIARVAFVDAGTAVASAAVNDKTAPNISGTKSVIGIWEPNSKEHTSDGTAWLKNNGQSANTALKASYMAVNAAFDSVANTYDNVATGEIFSVVNAALALASAKNFDSYVETKDTEIVGGKTYYTDNTGATAVESPVVENIGTYYEKVTKTGFDKTCVPTDKTYYVYTANLDAAAGEHFAVIDINSFFKPITISATLDGDGKVKDGVYAKTGTGVDAVYTKMNPDDLINVNETYYESASVGVAGSDVLAYTKAANANLVAMTTKSSDGLDGGEKLSFTIPANTIQKLTVYIWLEGQDCDCTNYVAGNPFQVNLKFNKQ